MKALIFNIVSQFQLIKKDKAARNSTQGKRKNLLVRKAGAEGF